jgi:hypothetical protein
MDHRYSILLVLVLFDGLQFTVPRLSQTGKTWKEETPGSLLHSAITDHENPARRRKDLTCPDVLGSQHDTHVLVSCSLTTEG